MTRGRQIVEQPLRSDSLTPQPQSASAPNRERSTAPSPPWVKSLAKAIRSPAELIRRLELSPQLLPAAIQASAQFTCLVPESYLARMEIGNPDDPLLRQVLPVSEEISLQDGGESVSRRQPSPSVDTPNAIRNVRRPDQEVSLEPIPNLLPSRSNTSSHIDSNLGPVLDAVGDAAARKAPGLLQKYVGRALLITTGTCAVNCRYCFRRHYPYTSEPGRFEDWNPAFDEIEQDDSIREIILSGGDPLILTDRRLQQFVDRIATIPHVRRLRVHTRLPIVLPNRVTSSLIDLLRSTRLTPIMVVHANHPNELVDDCTDALTQLVTGGISTLNQSVLLRGINDNPATLIELSERLMNVGVIPYYLHALDNVQGVHHFAVDDQTGRALIDQLRPHLPGYGLPRYVREIPGEPSKTPLT